MTSTNGSSPNGSSSEASGPDLGAAAADVGRIGEAGLRAAAAVVEQVLTLSRQLTEVRFPATKLGGPDGPGPVDPAPDPGIGPNGDRRRDLRTLRADAERLIELYGEWTRALVDGVTALAEGGDPGPPTDVVVLGPVGAGGSASTSVWLHTFEGPAAAPALLHVTELASHRRDVIAGSTVTFLPAVLDTAEAFATHEIAVEVAVPVGTPAGTYHGWVLADGLPEITLALRVEVE